MTDDGVLKASALEPPRMEGASPRTREDKDRLIDQLRMELQAERNKTKTLHEELRALREAQVQAVRTEQYGHDIPYTLTASPASGNRAGGRDDHKHTHEAHDRTQEGP